MLRCCFLCLVFLFVIYHLPTVSFPYDFPMMFCELGPLTYIRQLMATLSAAVPLRSELILHQLRESDAIYFDNRANLPSVTNLEHHC